MPDLQIALTPAQLVDVAQDNPAQRRIPSAGFTNDIRQVRTLLGHVSLKTTMIYVHVMNKPALAVTSPLDRLLAI